MPTGLASKSALICRFCRAAMPRNRKPRRRIVSPLKRNPSASAAMSYTVRQCDPPRQSRVCPDRNQVADRRLGQARAGRGVLHGHAAGAEVDQRRPGGAAPEHDRHAGRRCVTAQVRSAFVSLRQALRCRVEVAPAAVHGMTCLAWVSRRMFQAASRSFSNSRAGSLGTQGRPRELGKHCGQLFSRARAPAGGRRMDVERRPPCRFGPERS